MRLPNLLATRKGRIAAFFLMYLTEGLPIGFATTTVATQLRRQGVGTAEIGAFLALVMLPWAFKWAYGPLVDLIGSRRLGLRRGWILGAQAMMVLTLLPLAPLDPVGQLGLSNDQIGGLATPSQAATAVTCIAGGWLSDRVNLRRALGVYVLLLSLPGLALMAALQSQGWNPGQTAPPALVTAFMAAVLAYHLLFGFIYGARVAVFMGITQPAVAATQFAAYMALTNLSISYSLVWQGYAVQHLGYAVTLGLDALVGLACLAVLPLLRPRP